MQVRKVEGKCPRLIFHTD